MSTSIISSGFYPYTDLANSASHSATAVAGDIIFITLAYRDTASAIFSSPQWNGQTAVPCGARTLHGGFFQHDFYIKADSSATANITTASDNYTLSHLPLMVCHPLLVHPALFFWLIKIMVAPVRSLMPLKPVISFPSLSIWSL